MSVSPLLSSKEWNELFPEELYNARKVAPKESEQRSWAVQHLLKFMIAKGLTDTTVLPWISKAKGDGSQLNSKLTEHGLTVLHIATMRGREELVRALLAAGATDTPDAHGWYAMHHAALVSNDLMNLFLKQTDSSGNSQKGMGTPTGASCHDLQILAGKVEPEERHVLYYRHPDGRLEKLSKQEFQTRTGLKHYREEHLHTPAGLRFLWKTDSKKGVQNLVTKMGVKAFKDTKESPKRLAVGLSTLASNKRADFMGLFAAQPLNIGLAVGEYVGKYCEEVKAGFQESIDILTRKKEFTHSYVLGTCDAKEVGNFLRFANDGWPNCSYSEVINMGIPERVIVVTIDSVEEGEELFCNYASMFSIKWGPYRIAHTDRIRQFFQNRGLTKQLSEVKKGIKELRTQSGDRTAIAYYELVQKMERLTYSISTPAVLIYLVLNEISSPEEWLATLEDGDWGALMKEEEHSFILGLSTHLLTELKTMNLNLKDCEVKADIRKFFLDQLSHRPILQLADAIARLNACFAEKKICSADWTFLKKLLEMDPVNFSNS